MNFTIKMMVQERVAIIDSGPDPGHEAFTDKAVDGYFGKSKIVGVHDYTIGDQTFDRGGNVPLGEGDVDIDDTVDEGTSFSVGGYICNRWN